MHLYKGSCKRFYGSIAITLMLVAVFMVALNIRPIFADGDWWNSDWQYRKKITIDHTKVAADLTNFPVLIDTTDLDLASHAQTDGDDIVFTNNSGNQLKHEIELYSSGTGHLVAWVKVPSLLSTANTILYMYYGNSTVANQQNPTQVWDSNYVMVQHFNETSSTHCDSTSNGRDGTAYNGVVQGTAGKIDGADWFDGANDYVKISGDVVTGTSNTISFWEYNMTKVTPPTPIGYGRIFDDYSGSSGFIWQFGDYATDFQIGNVQDWSSRLTYTHGGLVDNHWHFYVATLAGGTITLYEDGTSVATQSSSTSIASDGDDVPIMGPSGHEAQGLMDELRVSNISRSADWISTCYNNQYDPGGFYSIGNEEEWGKPVVSDPSPSDGATGVSVSLTELSFNLTDPDADLMNYTVTTSPDIGGGSGTNVGDGVKTVAVSGLSAFTTYTWNVNVTDGTKWANVTYSFSTETPATFDPSDEGWLYRKQITIDHTNVATALPDFPLLLDVTDSDLASHAQSDGDDIMFMDGTGTANKLYHEIELYSGGAGYLIAWVRVPSLSSTVDTVLYMYYGKADAPSMENASGVWDSHYKMVQHLQETSGTHYDSTSNGNDGSQVGGLNQAATGKMNGADYFDGVDDYITFGDVLDITTGGATWSLWAKFDEAKIHRFFGKGSTGILAQWWNSSTSVHLEVGNVGDWSAAAKYVHGQDTNWHYITTVFDDSVNRYKLYLDGVYVAEGLDSSLPVDNSDSFVVGSGYTHEVTAFTKGILDEVRVSDAARSADWISTCYNNQYDPSSFYTVGTETGAGAPVVSDPSPSDGATGVSVSLSQLSFRLTDYSGDLMNYTVTTSPDIGGGSGTNVGDGVKTVSVSGLSHATTFIWHVNVTDGAYWTNVTYSFTTRPTILLSNPSPPDGGIVVFLNPALSIEVDHETSHLVNITFRTNATGTWQDIGSHINVGNGIHSVTPIQMTQRDTTYHWSVNATDSNGHWTCQNYSFTIVKYVGALVTKIGISFCCKFGYMRPARERGCFIASWQSRQASADIPEWGLYNMSSGWVKTNELVFNSGTLYHVFWGYWDDSYHYIDGYTGGNFEVADSSTFEGFQSMDFWSVYYNVGPLSWTNPTPTTYTFNDTYAWILSCESGWVIAYWPWSKASGWGAPVTIETTRTSTAMSGPALLRLNRTTWLVYYTYGSSGDVRYVKTTDSGQTWSSPISTGIPTHNAHCHRLSFARYGDNFYMFLVDSGNHPAVYNSTDGENWGNKQVINNNQFTTTVHHGCLLHQSALISTADDNGQDPGDQYGIITPVPEMLAYPGKPNSPYPANGANLPSGTTATNLEVTVHGDQTYDVAFYWADGTFIGEDRLLQEGDTAKVQVSGLSSGTYQWYAISRGATHEYCGNKPLATSDENRSDTFSFTIRVVPKLEMDPSGITCRKYCETFNVQINVTDAVNVEDFEFEIHYDTTLLDYVSVTWNAWATGFMDSSTDGVLIGSTSGSTVTGNLTLIIIEFHAAYHHIWKDCPGWTNDLTGTVYFQWANLSYPGVPDLRYERGGLAEINVDPDFVYTFKPIQGDVDNDGAVDIMDLRTVAAYYNVEKGDIHWASAEKYDLNCDDIIDIFDLVIIAVKFDTTYP